MSTCYCGYNPGFTTAFGIIQGITSLMSGITEAHNVKREGGTTGEAVASGIGTSLFGLANAGLGAAVNNSTHSYWGTAMSGFNALATDNFTFRNPGFLGLTMPFMFGGGYYGGCCGMTYPYDACGFYPGGYYC